MKKLLAIGAILFAMAISTTLMASEYGRGRMNMMPPGHHQEGPYAWYGKLSLTAEQKAKLETLRNTFLRDIKPLQDQMFSKRGDLRLLWLQATPDKEKIVAVQKDIRAIRDKIQDIAVAHRVDAYNTLTPEQRENVKTFLGRRGPGPGHGMWGDRGQKGMMGPGAGMMDHPCQ
jgi:Spy/CpxP family protein refolding chaperone